MDKWTERHMDKYDRRIEAERQTNRHIQFFNCDFCLNFVLIVVLFAGIETMVNFRKGCP